MNDAGAGPKHEEAVIFDQPLDADADVRITFIAYDSLNTVVKLITP